MPLRFLAGLLVAAWGALPLPAGEPQPITARQFYSSAGRESVTLTGIARDVFRDELDPEFAFLRLDCDGTTVYVAYYLEDDPDLTLEKWMGESVTASGTRVVSPRMNSGLILQTRFGRIRPAKRPPPNPFEAALLPDNLAPPLPEDIKRGRRRATGFVLAQWGGCCLIQTMTGRRLVAELAQAEQPRYGMQVEISGLPELDFHLLRMRHALWRTVSSEPTIPSEPVIRTTILDIRADKQGRQMINVHLNGRPVALRGRLILPEAAVGRNPFFYLEQNGEIARIDISSNPDILRNVPNGSVIDVTGVCIMETSSETSFFRTRDFFIVPRTEGDIRLVERPSRWTPGRFLLVLGVILAALIGSVTWSLALNRLSRRRGAELAREQLAVVETELKVYERTRLAIELHDFFSQMLSGISLQIDTVRKFFDSNREQTLRHLDLAAKTLLSCRESLRDCLWDLRSRALEAPDLDTAIRETLSPHVGDTALLVRFNVPRDRLTDPTAHAILSIVRELVVNAIRHGRATVVRIAGCIDGGRMLFSVADDGCGFDPDAAPGSQEGHFGLQGIRERVDGFDGELSLVSAPGKGTKVTIVLKLPNGGTGENDNG